MFSTIYEASGFIWNNLVSGIFLLRPENGLTGSGRHVTNTYDVFTPHVNKQHSYTEQYTTPAQPSMFFYFYATFKS